jgi:hypothetical protein
MLDPYLRNTSSPICPADEWDRQLYCCTVAVQFSVIKVMLRENFSNRASPVECACICVPLRDLQRAQCRN